MLLIYLLLTLIAVMLWKGAIRRRLFSVMIAILVFFSFFISGLYYAADYLTGSGINESVIFHLKAGLSGAGLVEFKNIIFYSAIGLVISFIISVFVYYVVREKHNVQKHKAKIVLASSALIVSFVINPGVGGLFLLSKNIGIYEVVEVVEAVEQPVDYLVLEKGKLNLNNKNLVYIYLESIERTYFDESLFPGLMPNLKRIESASLSFTEIEQIDGSGWTIAGMVSSQCGIPLVTPSGGNEMSGMYRFLPAAACIGDILSASGYDLSYVGGASANFAGKRNFFNTHGFNKIEGLDELKDEVADTFYKNSWGIHDYKNSWGIHDEKLFDILKQRFNMLVASGKPFGLFTLTLDTHYNGHETEFCKDVQYKDGSNPLLNAVHCADRMVAEFYDYIKNHQSFENTLVVIGSDHLAMRNVNWDDLQKGNRKKLLLISGEEIVSQKIAKPGALIDVAPTILNILGGDIEGLGFGRDLLGMNDTMLEQFVDRNSVNKYLATNRKFISSLWDFPQINDGIIFDNNINQVVFGTGPVKYPALILFDDNYLVKEIRFDFHDNRSLMRQLLSERPDQKFIWIDSCFKMEWINKNKDELKNQFGIRTIQEAISGERKDRANNCAAIGSLNSSNTSIFELDEKKSFSEGQILDIFKNLESDSHLNSTKSHESRLK